MQRSSKIWTCNLHPQLRSCRVMNMLIKRRVPVNYTDTLNQTALYYVARENQLKCVKMLVDLGKAWNNTKDAT